MITYSRTIRTSQTLTASPIVELIAGSGRPYKLLEVGIIIVNATASTFALGRPAAIGITPTTPVNLLSQLGGPNATAALAVAWGTGPTQPAAFYRECALPATAGASLSPIWNFYPSGGLFVPAGGSMILWSLTSVSVADVFFTIGE